jgi:tellurite resistance protein TerC
VEGYVSLWNWVAFHALILVLLAVDLGMHRGGRNATSLRSAAIWSATWIAVGLLFWWLLHEVRGPDVGAEFLSGYLIEKALSVDNLFVFALIFASFRVPPELQRRVLFWGILGALVMRGIMIGAGVYLVSRLDWILYLFGAMLVLTGLRMCKRRNAPAAEENAVLRWVKNVIPVTATYEGSRFFVHGAATPLFLTLVAIETTDVLFALDSVPAVFAVTTDPFIAYTSNALAILGLRSLYFLLVGGMRRLRHLETGLAALMIVIGVKMLLADVIHLRPSTSLLLIGLVLGASIGASLVPSRRARTKAVAPVAVFLTMLP